MCYGPDSGDPRLRRNVAQWLTDFYKPADAVSEERICISGGASQNLACLLQDFTDPVYTRNVWIVAPAYMLAFRIFEDAGFHKKLRAVPEEGEGIDMEYLRSQISKSEHKAKAENNNEPVSVADDENQPRICNQAPSCVHRIDYMDESPFSNFTNGMISNSNLHGLPTRYTSISSMQCRASRIPVPRP